MLIIGFGYRARRGKDTCAKAIIEARSGEFDIRRFGFGDALKKEVNRAAEQNGGMLGLFTRMAQVLPSWVTYDPDAPMDDPMCPLGKQRKLLQWWGTEYRRAEDPFYWVKRMKETLELVSPQIALITDVRFPNEYLWVKANAGVNVKVDRLGYGDLDMNAGHLSENLLNGQLFDIEITAKEGEVDQLRADAVEAFDIIVKACTPQEMVLDIAA